MIGILCPLRTSGWQPKCYEIQNGKNEEEKFKLLTGLSVPQGTELVQGCLMASEIEDRLSNLLTGIALKSGVLKDQTIDRHLRSKLNELEALAIEAVSLSRKLAQPEGRYMHRSPVTRVDERTRAVEMEQLTA
jgi:hypothetical protein